jgi:hypothetical protein
MVCNLTLHDNPAANFLVHSVSRMSLSDALARIIHEGRNKSASECD